MIKELLRYGADPNQREHHDIGFSPLLCAGDVSATVNRATSLSTGMMDGGRPVAGWWAIENDEPSGGVSPGVS